MNEIVDGRTIIPKFDTVSAAAVYTGSFCLEGLVYANHRLKWREDAEGTRITGVPYYELTLDEIAEQLKGDGNLITVFVEGPLDGVIYQHGNYGDVWTKCGTLGWYA